MANRVEQFRIRNDQVPLDFASLIKGCLELSNFVPGWEGMGFGGLLEIGGEEEGDQFPPNKHKGSASYFDKRDLMRAVMEACKWGSMAGSKMEGSNALIPVHM